MASIALEGMLYDPEAAARIGLVDEVVPADRVVDRAVERASAMGTHVAAYTQIKRALLGPALDEIDRVGILEREAWLDTWFSDDARVTLRAAVDRLLSR